jgi:signal-transduction protein with cAMP-binding, CBS, and nucleotidyltransferase domain
MVMRPGSIPGADSAAFFFAPVFYNGQKDWRETVQDWFTPAKNDRLIRRELDELLFWRFAARYGLIKPVTGQVVNEYDGMSF